MEHLVIGHAGLSILRVAHSDIAPLSETGSGCAQSMVFGQDVIMLVEGLQWMGKNDLRLS